jgi:aminoglycoside phosphotransferase (APT) family kinase protein
MDEEILAGGIGNAGKVVRQGDHVLRPTGPHTPAVHALLAHVRANGFDGVPQVFGIDDDGRERLEFIPGDVPIPPFPQWSQTEQALASTAVLLRRYHDAAPDFVPPADARWCDELADPQGGPVVCHNDVCPENVVYRDGIAVAIIDWDFAAPGRTMYDLAQMAKMCIPLESAESAARIGRVGVDPFAMLRVVVDAYGLPPDREPFLDAVAESMSGSGAFVQRRVERGEQAFIDMWNKLGGRERFVQRAQWFKANRKRFLDALG